MKTKTIMIRGVPENVVKDFRMICLKKDSSMTKEIIRIITEIVEKEGKKK